MPQVSSLEGTAREGLKETGKIFEKENNFEIFFRRFFGCGCGGPGNGIFAFSQRKRRQTGFGGDQETQERIFNLRCITAFVTGRKKVANAK